MTQFSLPSLGRISVVRGVRGLLRVCGSLWIALGLLTVLTFVLVWATLLESRHGEAAARFAIYGAWWFTTLGWLLGLNILAALVSRFPWSRWQLGFVVAHVGLLVLLTGCLITRWWGVEATLSVFEHRWESRAVQDSEHFQLTVTSQGAEDEDAVPQTISTPFHPGPFDWDAYGRLPWFPWRLAGRDQGVIYDRDGIRLEVLDYHAPLPYSRARQGQALVNLAIDDASQEFWLGTVEGAASPNAKRTVMGSGRQVSIALEQDSLDLGVRVYLRKFQRVLEPGTMQPSHFSSRIDLVEQPGDANRPGDKGLSTADPRSLTDKLISMNSPLDFTDPASGRSYRVFQSSYSPPTGAQPPENLGLAPVDANEDLIYQSHLTIGYDPGRMVKYAGCLLLVLGVFLRYYVKFGSRKAEAPRAGMKAANWMIAAVVLAACGAVRGDVAGGLDWATWERLPVLDKGRVMPLDTLAFVTVKEICGTPNPWLRLAGTEVSGDAPAETREWLAGFGDRRWTAPELVFAWLADAQKWEYVPFLPASDAQLRRDLLGVPLLDASGARLKYASPQQVTHAKLFNERIEHLRACESQARREGRGFEPVGLDKKAMQLADSLEEYRQLTASPENLSERRNRFLSKLEPAIQTWRSVEATLIGLRFDDNPSGPADLAQQVAETVRKLVSLWSKEGEEPSLKEILALVQPLESSLRELAQRVARLREHPRAAKAPPDIRRLIQRLSDQVRSIGEQVGRADRSLYDDGIRSTSLRLVPGLDASALEADRYRSDVHPWLSLQALLRTPEDQVAAYSVSEVHEVRTAYQDAVKTYRDVQCETRAEDFSDAMNRFAEALRRMGTDVEPARRELEIREREDHIIAATAYPAAGATDTEVFYNHLDPFYWAWVLCLAAFGCLMVAIIRPIGPWAFWPGIGLLLAAQGMVIAGLVLRGRITGWVPVTNMFETLVFVAACVALLGIGFTLLPPRTMFSRLPLAIVAAAVSLMFLLVAYYVPKFHREIQPLQPILRSNLWLAVHVKTIVASYGTAFLAWGLGNVVLGYYLFGRYRQPGADEAGQQPRPPEACAMLAGLIYKLLQVTVLLLTAGTILGGWWADKSWGRFWGWDSKEVWALVSILVYMLLLHARHVGWSSHFNLTLAAVLGGAAIFFTWYGVSFILATGMHSYGGGSGTSAMTWAVGAIGAVQLLFLAAAAVRYLVETHPSRA